MSIAREFDEDASQARDYCGAKSAPHRAARPGPSPSKERLAQDDNQEYGRLLRMTA
jgi:hypothetical protein